MRSETWRALLPAPARPRRLVVAEDDDELRAVLVDIFQGDGFDVSHARGGLELMRLLDDARGLGWWPDVIITDHRMPVVTGLDVARIVRAQRDDVPIIIITAFAADVDADAGRHNVDLVFQKPFDADDLRTAVLYLIDARSERYSFDAI